MKRFIKSLVLVTFVFGMTIPAWGQASTEGKDFWVANTIVCQPPTASDPAFPTIAVSAQKACKVTITDYAGNQLVTANVAAGSWTRFGDKNASVDPAEYYLDPSKWYPTANHINATDVYKHADKTNNYGLHITATENISVYVIMRTPQYSMDASNALPVSALQSEYYLQDFYPDANGVDKPITMTTILATEDRTRVVITPRGNTYGKNNNGTPFTITLSKGQTYYLISDVNSQLAGTRIVAQDGKKIAVYIGSPVTRLPDGVSARDGLFEQMMPIDYWGTQFIATRSMQKDGNIIGITATQNGTTISIDGYEQATINEGETYYLVLQGSSDPYAAKQSKITFRFDQIITADAVYIETSCPCAVISYDTGNSFSGSAGSEIVNGQGDPSSVWMSPIQQKINRITFGACYTKKTQAHFLNIVTETSTCSNTRLTAYMGQSSNDWSNKLSWTPVPGNPKYSYARVQIGDKTPDINVFTLENSRGFIAHVYGNGEDESYAYSAGSAAVEYGVSVNGETFVTGYISDSKFCFDQEVEFDANIGANEITRVDWKFGDGTSEMNGDAQTSHQYNSPGWYDVSASLYGHQACTDEDNTYLGVVTFSFRVVRPDTVFVDPKPVICIDPAEYATDKAKYDKLIAEGENDTLWDQRVNCYDPVQIQRQTYGLNTEHEYDQEGRDSALVNGVWYYSSQDVNYTIPNSMGCDSIITCHLKVITCLKVNFPTSADTQNTCLGEGLSITYTKAKGDLGEVHLTIPGVLDEEIEMGNENTDSGILTLPTYKITKPGHYSATLSIEDLWCDDKSIPLAIDIYYPQDIFKYKFNNVLAVYKPGYGGNKDLKAEFTAYQWYFNGQPIAGATESIYHTDGQIPTGNYYVELTDKSGMTLRSCGQDIVARNMTNQEPARKLIRNGQICIQIGESIYDIYGQKLE